MHYFQSIYLPQRQSANLRHTGNAPLDGMIYPLMYKHTEYKAFNLFFLLTSTVLTLLINEKRSRCQHMCKTFIFKTSR